MSLVKFSHTVFAMPFALTGFVYGYAVLGEGIDFGNLLLVILAMVFARNAAMGFNRYADRDIDALNSRTRTREIPSGLVSPWSVKLFILFNALFFIITAAFINRLSFILSFPALALILGYSLVKRFSSMSHYVLGLALAIAPAGAFIAVTGTLNLAAAVLSSVVLLWVSGFDIIYSLADVNFDKNHSLHSVPQAVGIKNALRISSAGHMMILPLLILFYYAVNSRIELLGLIYMFGALVFLVLLFWQHRIVSSDDLSRVNAAFFTANGIASLVFAIFTITDLLI